MLQRPDFCYEVGNDTYTTSNMKIVSIAPAKPGQNTNTGKIFKYDACYYDNPGTCARKARSALEFAQNTDEALIPVFGASRKLLDASFKQEDCDVEYVNGRCGEPGRDAPRRGPPE